MERVLRRVQQMQPDTGCVPYNRLNWGLPSHVCPTPASQATWQLHGHPGGGHLGGAVLVFPPCEGLLCPRCAGD